MASTHKSDGQGPWRVTVYDTDGEIVSQEVRTDPPPYHFTGPTYRNRVISVSNLEQIES